jgi:hypothetical protein
MFTSKSSKKESQYPQRILSCMRTKFCKLQSLWILEKCYKFDVINIVPIVLKTSHYMKTSYI